MQFKVGDRVEAIKPPINLEKSDPDEVGIGVIKEVNPRPFDGAYLVKLDSGPEWAYWESYLRPAPATPTPSITVGTQVRLTGVVGDKDGDKRIRVDFGEDAEDEWAWIPCKAKCLEVIRQPFKRGEVVWSCGAVATGIAYQVLADEAASGDVLLIKESDEGGNRSFVAHYSDFERRP